MKPEMALRAIERLALATQTPLEPQWAAEVGDDSIADDDEAVDRICARLGWPAPDRIEGRPRADQFPLLVHDPHHGWAVAMQWDAADRLRLAGSDVDMLEYDESQLFLTVAIPDPLTGDGEEKAISVFWRAIMRRKQPLVMAGLATIFANLLVLATSLYSMQLYDRVIPLASYDTLLVLTVGVIFALLLDLVLRSLRAALIEREAAEIDSETAEFFYARAQAVRLDRRPPGIGTLAAQIRGQEQIRQVMSSSSLFLLADLPFALFFIFVVFTIGGKIALIPILSLPLAIGIAFLLARMIRTGAERAQVSGHRKNGMLVESLDAAETVKANRGAWLLLGRWNRLVREVHGYDLKIRRISAISSGLFSALQQTAYVAIMGWGAYMVTVGELTVGALLACSIIAGRINGPLVAQLPNLILQWSYARSSLKQLDAIMALPLDHSVSGRALRPEAMGGEIMLGNVKFGYPGGRAALEIDNLRIVPGERVAVMGGIGSGKSTLLRILSGLYEPLEGSVLIGGLDAAQLAEDRIRRHIGYLPQDARLLNGSLRDNLIMGIEDVGDGALMEMAKKTRLDTLIASHPQGLSLAIEEGGRGLSGGQRSLVMLNRMLHARPKIWLLDEPTASLDQATEQAVFAALDEAMGKDDILVMVTHKPQLLGRFSRIVVMRQGKVQSDGEAQAAVRQLQARAQPVVKKPAVKQSTSAKPVAPRVQLGPASTAPAAKETT